jgi:hypothetical protein
MVDWAFRPRAIKIIARKAVKSAGIFSVWQQVHERIVHNVNPCAPP